MRAIILGCGAAMLLLGVAAAAGSDGSYSGKRTPTRGTPPTCADAGNATWKVENNEVKAQYGPAHFSAPIGADGSFSATVQYTANRMPATASLKGRLTGSTLEADTEGYACQYHYVLQRK